MILIFLVGSDGDDACVDVGDDDAEDDVTNNREIRGKPEQLVSWHSKHVPLCLRVGYVRESAPHQTN